MLDTVAVDRSLLKVLPGASGTFVFPTNADGLHPWPLYRPAEVVPTHVDPSPHSDVCLVFGMPDFDAFAAGWISPDIEDVLIWDRQGFLSRARDSSRAGELAATRKFYLANLEEVRDEFPAASAEEALKQLPPRGFSEAIVKRGRDGCTVIDSHSVTDVSGFPVDTSATIGSGDVFAGALAAALHADLSPIDAARRANAAAAAFLEHTDVLADGLLGRMDELIMTRE